MCDGSRPVKIEEILEVLNQIGVFVAVDSFKILTHRKEFV